MIQLQNLVEPIKELDLEELPVNSEELENRQLLRDRLEDLGRLRVRATANAHSVHRLQARHLRRQGQSWSDLPKLLNLIWCARLMKRELNIASRKCDMIYSSRLR